MVLTGCGELVPMLLCRHRDVLLYLAPSLLLALAIRALAARHPFFFLFKLAGTICHELAHFCVGWLTYARPASFTIIPRRVGQGWELGSVMLTRVRWYNAAPAALAPFLVVLLPFLAAAWRTRGGWHFEWLDVPLAFFIAPQFLACWPSPVDWKIAALVAVSGDRRRAVVGAGEDRLDLESASVRRPARRGGMTPPWRGASSVGRATRRRRCRAVVAWPMSRLSD